MTGIANKLEISAFAKKLRLTKQSPASCMSVVPRSPLTLGKLGLQSLRDGPRRAVFGAGCPNRGLGKLLAVSGKRLTQAESSDF